jgi:predicted metal-dependent HD superfamily phosphohydrolase
MRDLERDWLHTIRTAGSTVDDAHAARAGADLLARWQQSHRHYHDREHLAEVLDAVDLLGDLATDLPAVRLAAWFHDAVYAGRPGDDEEASAVVAGQVLAALRVPARRVAEVVRLVRLTARHDPADDDLDGQVLCDADLAILAAPPDRYARYCRAVRAEYAQVPDDAFRAGRAAVLEGLATGRLYRTTRGHECWDAAARFNLERELSDLQA